MRRLSSKNILTLLTITVVLTSVAYQFIFIDMKYLQYAISLRLPKLITMILAAFCIGTASIAFQSIINNRIVTPCLLGMNSLYSLIHTAMVFVFGSASMFVVNKNICFLLDLIVMGGAATLIYGYLFKKTKYNVLYVLLAGTVIATFFTSVTNSLIRIMDPNEYASLQDQLIAGFNNVNSDILCTAAFLIIAVYLFFKKEIDLLDVIVLGRHQAINLGVSYDKTVAKLLLAVTLYIAVATALVGPISFLGLIIANISRQLFKTYKHIYLLLGSALLGIIILVTGQGLIEHVFRFSTTISIFINIFGGMYFLYLILKSKTS